MVFLSSLLPMLHAGSVLADQDLIVSAAQSLTNAFGELGKKFEAANPGIKVAFNFAASGPLLRQIEGGAPVDIFASADQETMDQAKEKQLILSEEQFVVLIRKPNLLLLDEPFSALDTMLRARLRSELLRIQAMFSIPVIMITHDPEDVEVFAETFVTYDTGRVCEVRPFMKRNGEQNHSVDLLLGGNSSCLS
jgi:ABC-type phosphate transport system ATPase subunit